ncbi:aldo/keto reductase [Halalkalibacter oceani]|uniref:aldo/keto reductase n=1 Tax=Halalkalibacter oceani TaxID=1653776 RepID=UPI0033961BCA
MKKRRIGNSELIVSELGLGCMSIGTNKKEAAAVIDAALAEGINYLDTADLYDQGMNETIIGEVIKQKRGDIILATKAGNRFEPGKEGWSWDPSKKHIKSALKQSLTRLQTDYIDLFQLHGGTIEDHIDETIEAFEELKQEGVIRYYGISSIRPNVIREYVKRSSIVSVMMQYSLLDRRPEPLFPLLEEHHISVLARGPLAKGLLTNRSLAQASSAIKENGYLDYSYDELTAFKQKLSETIVGEKDIHVLAFGYCLASPAVASVVAGASKPEQIIASSAAMQQAELTEDEINILQQLTKAGRYTQHQI